MKKFCFSLLICLFAACSSHREYDNLFCDIDSYINSHPDSALTILRDMDISNVPDKSMKARYALLHSIALDKSYIDVKNDSIIAPAVEYYSRHGSSDLRCRAYYYEARIHENRGDLEKALLAASKVNNLNLHEISDDILYRLYFMKGRIYRQIWRREEARQSFTKSAEYALKDLDTNSYIHSCLNVASVSQTLKDTATYEVYMDKACEMWEKFSLHNIHFYYDIRICGLKYPEFNSAMDFQSDSEYIYEYINNYNQPSLINWKNIANVFSAAGKEAEAIKYLTLHTKYHSIENDPGYYSIMSSIMEKMGKYKEALHAHKEYTILNNTQDILLHESDIKLMEERYINHIKNIRSKHLYLSTILILLIIFVICAIILSKKIKEKSNLFLQLENLKAEYETLKHIEKNIKQDAGHKLEIVEILNIRMHSLSSFLKRPIPDSLSKASNQIKALKSGKYYITDNIGLLYALNYPEFVYELKKYDLTASEIGVCCLYTLNLSPEEMGDLIGKSGIYNINSGIRKKLNLTGKDGKLNRWLITLFEKTYHYED